MIYCILGACLLLIWILLVYLNMKIIKAAALLDCLDDWKSPEVPYSLDSTILIHVFMWCLAPAITWVGIGSLLEKVKSRKHCSGYAFDPEVKHTRWNLIKRVLFCKTALVYRPGVRVEMVSIPSLGVRRFIPSKILSEPNGINNLEYNLHLIQHGKFPRGKSLFDEYEPTNR